MADGRADGRYKLFPDAVREAARIIYESNPTLKLSDVANEIGAAAQTVKQWSSADGGWGKNEAIPLAASKAARDLVNQYKTSLAEYGPEITPDDREKVRLDLTLEKAIDLRVAVLERHRKEWSGPRTIAYEAMKKKDFDLAKLAKTLAETLKITQEGERKAWQIDRPDEQSSQNVTVVIERS